MRSIFGALLTFSFATSMSAAIAEAPNADQVTDSVASQLTMSYAGAEAVAQQYPRYASEITAAAKESFVAGDQLAYLAGIAAVLLGAALVYLRFPGRDAERALLARYHEEDESGRRQGESE